MKIILTMLLAALCFSPSALAEVNINTASEQELADSLKNVGMKKAMAIVEYRKINGDFKSVDDLTNVVGIGEVTVEINRDVLTVDKQQKNVLNKGQNVSDSHKRSVASMEQ